MSERTAEPDADLANLGEPGDRYRILFEMAPDVIFGISVPDGQFTDLSPSFEDITGWQVSDWLGKPFASIVHPDELPRAEEVFGMLLRGDVPPRHELRIRTRAETYAVAEITVAPRIANGRVVSVIGIARDITRRRRMEEIQNLLVEAGKVLAPSLDWQETLAQATRLSVPTLGDWVQAHVIVDEEAHLAAAAHIEVEQGNPLSDLIRNYPIDLDADSPLSRVLRTGENLFIPSVTDAHLQAVASDEEHLRLLRALDPRSAMVVPLTARERTFGLMILVTSVSGRQYGLEDLEIAEELARRAALAVENARLFHAEQRARTLAEAAVRERDEFLSVAAHELKTPITSLRGFSQLLVRRFDKERKLDPTWMRPIVQIIATQSSRLAILVNRLLDDSRFDAGRLAMEKRLIDVSALVEGVVLNMRQTTTLHTIEMRSPGPMFASVDPLHVEQVMVNLLDNAIRYSPDGGAIEVELTGVASETIRVTVRDYGIGIPPGQREHIFERFFRAHAQSYRSGMGLGLSICRQIVEMHGGTIEAQFPPDGGTRFVVTMPANNADQKQ